MRAVDVDGSLGEGGGQMLRSALSLSALTGKGVRVRNIRANRPRPGLSAQHLTAVRGVAAVSRAEVEGDRLGSEEVTFRPGDVLGGSHRLSVGTAGSVTLVLQACLLPLARADGPSSLEISGGTNVRWSPPVDYYVNVLFPLLRRMGLDIDIEIPERGFHPEGGGSVRVGVRPARELMGLDLEERGELRALRGVCFSRNLPEHVCRRMSHRVKGDLIDLGEVRISSDEGEGPSTGAGICLFAEFDRTVLGSDGLGERGMPAEKVADTASSGLREEIGSAATLDVHAADQLLPFMATATGASTFWTREMSGHLRTQFDLVSRFLEVDIQVQDGVKGHRVCVMPTRT